MNNLNIMMNTTTIKNCVATTCGGVQIVSNNNEIVFLLSSIINNTASVSTGGGIGLSTSNPNFILAGTVLSNNTAITGGAAVYMKQSHVLFTAIDADGYNNRYILQTTHPYASGYPTGGSPYVIFSQVIAMTNVLGYNLCFDAATNMNLIIDTLNIYTSVSADILIFSTKIGGLPGINMPCIFISYESFYIQFIGSPSYDDIPTAPSNNYYGFLMYIYPVIINPIHPTIFEYNTVTDGSGGGMYLYSSNNFALMINTYFNYNSASSGGK